MEEKQHVPVLVEEVMAAFRPVSGDTLLDATLGLGGHAAAYLAASKPAGFVVGLDADAESIKIARVNLTRQEGRVVFIQANFANLASVLAETRQTGLKDLEVGGGIVKPMIPTKFSHILFDLGFNSYQVAGDKSGLSFGGRVAPLMRYGDSGILPNSWLEFINVLTDRIGSYPDVPELINCLAAREIAEIIRVYGEERYAGRIGRAIKAATPATARELAEVVTAAVPGGSRHGRIHPATRTFQALRLAVNRELETLTVALPQAARLLISGGVLAVISFHSLEDRLVKKFMRSGIVRPVNKKPIVASEKEVKDNPRSRSAKLRVGELVSNERTGGSRTLNKQKQTDDSKNITIRGAAKVG